MLFFDNPATPQYIKKFWILRFYFDCQRFNQSFYFSFTFFKSFPYFINSPEFFGIAPIGTDIVQNIANFKLCQRRYAQHFLYAVSHPIHNNIAFLSSFQQTSQFVAMSHKIIWFCQRRNQATNPFALLLMTIRAEPCVKDFALFIHIIVAAAMGKNKNSPYRN